MNTNKIDLIKAEVERLKSNLIHGACASQIAMETYCKEEAYDEVLAILDTMQEEPKQCMYSKDNYTDEDRKVLCEDCKEKCAYTIAGVISTNAQNKKDPVSEEQVKEPTKTQHVKETCKENGNSLTQEPVNEDLEEAAKRYATEGDEISGLYIIEPEADAFKAGANWQKQQMERYRIKHCKSLTNEQAELEENFVSSHVEKNNRIPTFIDAIEYGMEYCKQQMMKDAIDTIVKVDAGGYPYIPQIELYDYYKDISLAKEGDKYKVILIKEG